MTGDQALSFIEKVCTDPNLDYGTIRGVHLGATWSGIYLARCADDIPWHENEEIGTGDAIAFFGDERYAKTYVLIRETATQVEIEEAVARLTAVDCGDQSQGRQASRSESS